MNEGISRGEEEGQSLIITAYFTLSVSVFVASVVGIINFVANPDKATPFKDLVRKSLLAYFKKLNKNHEKRGLEWYVHDNYFWIELKIN